MYVLPALICGLQVSLQAVLSILLATFAGFGVAMSGSSILVEFFRLRRRWQAQLEQRNGSQVMTQPGQFPRSLNSPRIVPPERGHQTEVQNPETFSGVWNNISLGVNITWLARCNGSSWFCYSWVEALDDL